jgi:L-amino acid N-acyltransferase YncA
MNCQITALRPEDWAAAREIYREGIATGNATFETELPSWEKWDSTHRQDCRLAARELIAPMQGNTGCDTNGVLGFAALSPVSTRAVYAGVAEISVYVAAAARGRGVGKALLPENVASIALHKSCGFREVGVRRRIGKLGDTWRDVLLLERRSSKAGN